jgi:hypothetical protein
LGCQMERSHAEQFSPHAQVCLREHTGGRLAQAIAVDAGNEFPLFRRKHHLHAPL